MSTPAASLDFPALAQAALPHAEHLLRSWFPAGKISGREFRIGNLSGDKGDSLSVSLRTGEWADFASTEKGGDLIALYAAIHGLKQGEAAAKLAEEIGYTLNGNGTTPPAKSPTEKRPIGKPPVDAPLPSFVHPKYGPAAHHWKYTNADGALIGYISRHDPPGDKKQIVPWSWNATKNKWKMISFPKPRPLYGLELLAAHPSRPVLVVEGEKSADAAREIAGEHYIVITWPGGTKAVQYADWVPLHGRALLLWPDADEPGVKAMKEIAGLLHGRCPTIKIVNTGGQPDGWDLADAEGWDFDHLVEWAKPRAQVYQAAAPKSEPNEHPMPSWTALGLILTEKGSPVANLENALRVLKGCPEFQGAIWFDTFHQKIFTTWRGPRREWTDLETLSLTSFMQGQIEIRNLSDDKTGKAVIIFAHRDERNEPRDWMESLAWDGMDRIAQFFEDSFGADGSEYVRAASRNFFIGMVARVYSPGCKVDTMPVNEGPQGILKSTALKEIGGPWFAEVSESVTSKDFYLALQGKLLLEISELDSFSRADITAVKRALSCRSDRFRAPYERSARDWPRQCVFAGTTNRSTWHSDESGARRFWPIRCTEIRLDNIQENREQLFAEAIARFKAGETWWEMPPEETAREQAERRQEDPWEGPVREYVEGLTSVRVPEILTHHFLIDRGKQSKADEMRVSKILVSLGWERRNLWDKDKGTQVRTWEKA